MRIARVVLEAPVGHSVLRNARNPWRTLREAIYGLYLASAGQYADRLRSVLALSKSHKADITVFPAYSFPCKTPSELNRLCSLLPNVKGYVVGGAAFIEFDREDDYFEAPIVLKGNTPFEVFWGNQIVAWLNLMDHPVGISLSSTIRDGYADERHVYSPKSPWSDASRDVIAFDLGHHQYSGRYMQTLRSVLRNNLRADFGGHPSIILSFWRPEGCSTHSEWMIMGRNARNFNIRSDRFIVDHDYVDMIDVN